MFKSLLKPQIRPNFRRDWQEKAVQELVPENCNVAALFEPGSYRLIPNNSASQSVQFFSDFSVVNFLKSQRDKLDPRESFCKFFLEYQGTYGLVKETELYAYLDNLVSNARTPNIMRFIVSFSCPRFLENYEDHPLEKDGGKLEVVDLFIAMFGIEKVYDMVAEKVEIPYEIRERGKNFRDLRKVPSDLRSIFREGFRLYMENTPEWNRATGRFLFVERGNGFTLKEFISRRDYNADDLMGIMFQIGYTLREMALHGVRHNDLHIGNVWLNVEEEPKTIIYFYDEDKFVQLTTRFLVKIFDFDNSTYTDLPMDSNLRNVNLNYLCASSGLCERNTEKIDLYLTYSSIYSKTRYYNLMNSPLPQGVEPAILKFFDLFVRSKAYRNPHVNDPDSVKDPKVPFSRPGRICRKVVKNGKWRCDPDYVPSDSEILGFEGLMEIGAYGQVAKPRSIREFPMDLLPIKKRENPNQIAENVFQNSGFYVSAKTGKTAIEMANALFSKEKPSISSVGNPYEPFL